jgi:hypothetical protein
MFSLSMNPDFIRAGITMSLAGSAVALLLFAIKPLIKDRLPKTFQYYAWLIVLLSLLVPFSMFVRLPAEAVGAPVAAIHGTVQNYVVTAGELLDRMDAAMQQRYGAEHELFGVDADIAAKQDIPLALANIDLIHWFAIVATLGAQIFLGVHICGYLSFAARLKRQNMPARTGERAMLASLVAVDSKPAKAGESSHGAHGPFASQTGLGRAAVDSKPAKAGESSHGAYQPFASQTGLGRATENAEAACEYLPDGSAKITFAWADGNASVIAEQPDVKGPDGIWIVTRHAPDAEE